MKYIVAEHTQISIFRTQIMRSKEGYNGYDDVIQTIAKEAKSFVEGKVTIPQINRNYFPLIMHLVSYGRPFLCQKDFDHPLISTDYDELIKILSTLVSTKKNGHVQFG